MRNEAPGTADQLAKGVARYERTGAALEQYSVALEEAQELAGAARSRAQGAQDRLLTAQQRLQSSQDLYDADRARHESTAGLAAGPPDDSAIRSAQRQIDEAHGDLRAAAGFLADAVVLRRRARDAAADAIRDVINHDGLKDSSWDKIKGWVGKHADVIKKISDIASWVATACGVLALAVGWIPFFGQGAAALLMTVGLAATAVALLGHLTLALTDNGDWLDVGLDAFALATFGIGRAFSVGAKSSFVGARTSARVEAYAVARAANPGASRGALYREVNRLTGGKAGLAVARPSVVAEAGTSRLPSMSRILESYDPRVIWRESVDGIRTSPAAWEASKGANWARFNMDAASELGRFDDILVDTSAIAAFNSLKTQGYWQLGGWAATTLSGLGADGADRLGALDSLKRESSWTP